MSKAANLLALGALGQSVWYDNISRELLVSGGSGSRRTDI